MSNPQIIEAVNAAFAAAQQASQQAMPMYDRRDACGFAWVTIRPATSSLARYLAKIGAGRKAYGGGLMVWNPGKSMSQSITVVEEGAQAFAQVLRERLGVDVRADSRMD
jgi:hypothetical protein